MVDTELLSSHAHARPQAPPALNTKRDALCDCISIDIAQRDSPNAGETFDARALCPQCPAHEGGYCDRRCETFQGKR